MRARTLCAVVAVVLVAVGLPADAAHGPPLTTRLGVVAADHPMASQVGAATLESGGNAVDAAAATALALGVVNPTSSGIGGGGFAIVYVAAERKVYVYDFRETAPAALGPDDFVVGGKVDASRSRSGGLAVGVPGEIAGLHQLVTQHGRRSWRRAVAPAARLARDGFRVEHFLAQAIKIVVSRLPDTPAFAPLRAMLAPNQTPLLWGDRLVRPELARTLLAIGAQGPRAFYEGPIAADIVATTTAAGGVLTADDLADYQVVAREPLWGNWRGLRIATMPLPSSGGVVMLEMLGILDASGLDLAKLGPRSSAAYHVIAEVLKHGFADRARLLGDSDPARASAAHMLEPGRLAALAKRIRLDRTGKPETYGDSSASGVRRPRADAGTSHVCVVDADGNAVALTTTVNGYFGAGLVTAGGVVLKNEMDDFAIESGVANMFGLVQSDHNLVGPGKRPLSSMSPTLVFDGDKVVACVGGSGGPRIISNTFQTLLNMFVFGMDARAAVESPRVHHQWAPDKLIVDGDVPSDVVDALRARGHDVELSPFTTAVQVIRVRPDGLREAASDPRKGGAPAAQDDDP